MTNSKFKVGEYFYLKENNYKILKIADVKFDEEKNEHLYICFYENEQDLSKPNSINANLIYENELSENYEKIENIIEYLDLIIKEKESEMLSKKLNNSKEYFFNVLKHLFEEDKIKISDDKVLLKELEKFSKSPIKNAKFKFGNLVTINSRERFNGMVFIVKRVELIKDEYLYTCKDIITKDNIVVGEKHLDLYNGNDNDNKFLTMLTNY